MKVISLKTKEKTLGLLITLPAILLLLFYYTYPLLSTFYYSFTDFSGLSQNYNIVYFDNFKSMFTSQDFLNIFKNNLYLMVLTVPGLIIFPLLISILMYEGIKFQRFFKTVFMLPTIFSAVVVGVIFNIFFSYNGLANEIVGLFGIQNIAWLNQGITAIPTIAIAKIWTTFGINTMILVAALSSIPSELYEAAELEEITWFKRIRYITVPMLKPVLEFITVQAFISVFSGVFGLVDLLTGGGPGIESTMLEYLVYIEGFKQNKIGFASAVAVILFVVLSITVFICRRLFRERE